MKITSHVITVVTLSLYSILSLAQESLRGPDYRNEFKPNTRLMFEQQGLPQVCFAVDDHGSYQIQKRSQKDVLQTLAGTLDPDQLKQLKGLLEEADFLAVDESRGAGLLRKGSSETFTAEVPTSSNSHLGNRKFVRAVNIDGENPFPPAIQRVVNWLQSFSPGQTRMVDAAQPCPAAGTQPASSQ